MPIMRYFKAENTAKLFNYFDFN